MILFVVVFYMGVLLGFVVAALMAAAGGDRDELDAAPAIRKPHWTEHAERVRGDWHPLWGHLGENENGVLLCPAWRTREGWDGWWNRRLNLRRPTHWLPYLRSRLTRKVAWLDGW